MLDLLQLSDKFFDVSETEELKRDTDSLHLALAEQDLFDSFQTTMKKQLDFLQSRDSMDDLSVDRTTNFFPRDCHTNQK